MNLIVGDSGTGKTRLLNTIFNSARTVRQKQIYIGYWDTTVEHLNHKYRWIIHTCRDEKDNGILLETVSSITGEGQEHEIIHRTPEQFLYNGKEMPNLSTTESSISLFKNDDLIKPLYDGFGLILRRKFAGADLEMSSQLEPVPQSFLKKVNKHRSIQNLWDAVNFNLSPRLYILQNHFPDIFNKIKRLFINTFPFVLDLDVKKSEDFGIESAGIVPIVAMKEKHVKKWIAVDQFSSGMKKVLLILVDIFSMPDEGGVYLIDEYENSLGINAINFFPSMLSETDTPIQFIITSHHPYIIGNIPVKNWIILYRKGSEIMSKQGSELEERYGKSKQKAFIQLINDPFYSQGIQQ
jgi:hypothetical protein